MIILAVMATTKAASLADDLVQRFEERIEKGEMSPGARFPTEKAITETFGVSRTVVREAYSRLAARGLLVSRRGSGAFVPDGAQYRAFQIAAEEVDEIDDVLRLLEMRMGFEAEMADLVSMVCYLGPAFSVIRGSVDTAGGSRDFNEDETFGAIAGVDLYLTRAISLGANVQYYNSPSWGDRFSYHF